MRMSAHIHTIPIVVAQIPFIVVNCYLCVDIYAATDMDADTDTDTE